MVRVHKTPYARFDWNDYSVPHTHVRRTLEVRATPDTVRILDAGAVIATHPRSYDRGEQVEEPPHIKDLADQKRSARRHRAMDRLHHAAPSGAKFFAAAAQRGVHLGALTRGLTDLLDTHGAAALRGGVDRGARRGLHPSGRRAPLHRSTPRPARRTAADPGASAR